MNNLIELSQRFTSLLQEYKQAKEIEQHDYLIDVLETGLVELFDTPKNYVLYDIKKREVIKVDKAERIKSFMNLRGLNKKKIYYKAEEMKPVKLAKIRADLLKSGTAVPIGDCFYKDAAPLPYRWVNEDQFQVKLNGYWKEAESIDFEFIN